MRNHYAAHCEGRTAYKVILLLLIAALSLTCVSGVKAQKEKKKKPDPAASSDNPKTLVVLTDEQQIDYLLSDMLGAWQLGDVEKLRKDYADDVAFVNASWAPPVFGWANYLAIYQQQITRMQRVRMDRSNTYIKVSGTVGWACYQWDFEAVVDGQPAQSKGQTTVVLEKRNSHWVIVLNHTSLAANVPQTVPATTPKGQEPTKPSSR